MTGMIFDLRRYAVHDGPGIRTTVFLKGCPLSCAWCHNPESQSFKPELMLQESLCISCNLCLAACLFLSNGAGVLQQRPFENDCQHCASCATICPTQARLGLGQEVTATHILPILLRDKPFYDQSDGGVTLSGGEPLAQPDFIEELLTKLKKEEVHTCLDTSGYADPNVIKQVAPLTDLFLFDFKHSDPMIHQEYCGLTNELILSNLVLLAELKAEVIIRMPLIPGINNNEENLKATGLILRQINSSWPVQLLPYHQLPESKYLALDRHYALQGLHEPSPKQMEEAISILRKYLPTVSHS